MVRYRLSGAILIAAATLSFATTPAKAQLFLNVSVGIAPPPLPVYAQPPLPGPDYIWQPGYWAWDSFTEDYYWVPGTWVMSPRPGYVWTPPWWGWNEGAYVFHSGYWGAHVGWYGGVAYGFGYTCFGFEGGYWRGPHYFYNRSVNNITNVNVTNVYNKTVIVNRTTVNNVSYNGGPHGLQLRPTPDLLAAEREPHIAPTADQQRHMMMARSAPQLFAHANHGAPPIAATAAPARLVGPGLVRAEAVHNPSPSRPTFAETVGRPGGELAPSRPGETAPSPYYRSRPVMSPALAGRQSAMLQGQAKPVVTRGDAVDQVASRRPNPGHDPSNSGAAPTNGGGLPRYEGHGFVPHSMAATVPAAQHAPAVGRPPAPRQQAHFEQRPPSHPSSSPRPEAHQHERRG